MKVTISIPDDLHDAAACLADRLNVSRSRLYGNAMREYVARHDPDAMTARLNRVADAIGTNADSFLTLAAAQTLARADWELPEYRQNEPTFLPSSTLPGLSPAISTSRRPACRKNGAPVSYVGATAEYSFAARRFASSMAPFAGSHSDSLW